jgi:hypothetical protein
MATRPLTAILLKSTGTASSPNLIRKISSHSWKGVVTLKPGPLKTVTDDVYDFCAFAGLDDAGANHAVIAYAPHSLAHIYAVSPSFERVAKPMHVDRMDIMSTPMTNSTHSRGPPSHSSTLRERAWSLSAQMVGNTSGYTCLRIARSGPFSKIISSVLSSSDFGEF